MSKSERNKERDAEEEIVLQADGTNQKFKYEVSKLSGAESVSSCFQCGTCTADCPIARFNDFYRPRKLIRMIQLGLRSKLVSNDIIWLCSTCFTCVDHCPQDVGIADVIRAIRNLAAEEESVPVVYKQLASNILKTGYAYVISGPRLKKRETMGLPLLPNADLENLARLFDLTGLSATLERMET